MIRITVREERFTDELLSNKGYVMKGRKGDFITARNKDGKYVWVRLTPTNTRAKSIHTFDTLQEAVENKIAKGYEVYEYNDVELV